MAEMKTLNGYEVVDAAARADIELLKAKEPDLSGYYTKSEVDAKDAAVQTNLDNHNHDNEYAPKTHNHSYNDLTDKPTIPSTAGLASEAYVDEAIAAIPKPKEVDLEPYVLESELKSKGYATEVYVTNYVNKAIADIPETDDCKLVYIGTRLTADEAKAKIKSVLEAGKIPVYSDMMYTGQGNADLGTSSTDFYYHFSSTGLSKDYDTKEETIVMRYTKFYPNRTQPWDMGYIQRLVRYQEFKALEERVAALEGGTN
jgi:hypothetical protein